MDTTTPQNRFERRKQRTRSQLQRAAIELVLEKGYDNITIQNITDRADFGRATFYLYYKDKEEIVWKAIQEEWDRIDRELNKGYSPYQTFDEYPGLVAVFQQADAQRSFYKIVFGSSGSAALIRRMEAYLAAEVEREIKQRQILGVFSSLPPVLVSQFVIGACVRLFVWWIETPNKYNAKQMATMLYEMLHHTKPV